MQHTTWLKNQRHLSGRNLSYSVALGVLSGFLLILQAGLLAQIIDQVIFHEATIDQVLPWLWGLLLVYSVRALLTWLSEQTAFRAAVQVKLQLRDQIYRHIQQLGPAYLSEASSGDLANMLSDGVEALEAYYARFLPAIALMALVPLSILAFVFPVDWISGLVMLATAPLIPFFMILIGKGAERKSQQQWRQLARMSAHFLDIIQGLTSLKLFNASQREAQVIARISDQYRCTTLSVLRVAFLSAFALEFFSTISIAVVAVFIGFRLYWGEMNFLYGFFVLLLAPEFYAPLRNMGSHYHARMAAIGAAERMIEILETPLPATSGGHHQPLPAGALRVSFDRVGFEYRAESPALTEISFTIEPGERLALVGPSGAGKSTLFKLLLGFIQPRSGEILVNGRPLNAVDPAHWRSQLAWVPQNPTLFHGTLLQNIMLGRPGAGMRQVEAAAEAALASEFIQQLPDGYQTRVGERGVGLSGGQIQRIVLARAFLRDAPLVLLDEATANLDLQSEQQVQQAIERLARNRSMLVIAHRLNTVRHADRILVLDQGRLVQQGDHATLAGQPGLYRQMVDAYRIDR